MTLAIAIGASYLLTPVFFGAADTGAEPDPNMSEESLSLLAQARIAECLADESRELMAAWMLDMRSSSGYASAEYGAGMVRLIKATSDSVDAAEAWADVAKRVAADGTITAAERGTLEMADLYMATAAAGVYDAALATPAGQMGAMFIPDLTEAYMQAAVLTGAETECY